MAKDLNKVMFTGYLGADPESRYTSNSTLVASFRVGSSRSWKSQDGTQNDETEWFKVSAFDKLAEICTNYLSKGTRVYIEGRLQTRKWQDKEGNDRYTTEVMASDMIILSSKNSNSETTERPAAQRQVDPRYTAQRQPPQRNVSAVVDESDDLPF